MAAAFDVAQAFAASFGTEPDGVFSAPARVNLIGEHTDYNGGFVLPVAIDRRIYLAINRRDDASIRATASDFGGASSTWGFGGESPVERDARQAWANYLRGVSEAFRRQSRASIGMDVYIRSDIPIGAGLGSSAALCAAFARALDAVNDLGIPAHDLAAWCQAAEHEYAGSRCGIMDQIASLSGVEGHALLIDCRSLAIDPVPLPGDAAVVIVESGQSHRHGGGRYNERRAECEAAASAMGVASLREAAPARLEAFAGAMNQRVFRRARHVLTENARTLAMAEALAAGDYAAIGRLMAASHASMRDEFEMSTAEIDALVELVAQRLGGEGGARLTGGGFGGSIVALAPAAAAESIDRHLVDRYHRQTGLTASVHRCRAVSGARRE